MKTSSGFCPNCEKRVRAESRSPNHVLHLFLTIFTAGLWGIVWLTLGLISLMSPYKCTRCGCEVEEA